MKKEIGIIGLGKMGGNIAKRLAKKRWHVVGYNRTHDVTKKLAKEGVISAESLQELIKLLSSPRVVLLSLPAGKATNDVIDELLKLLGSKDTIIDGANAYYLETQKNAKKVQKKGIHYIDAGISGGPGGALNGACIMIGGEKNDVEKLTPLWRDMALKDGFAYFGEAGAGHFVKMVHNGIEYGMMQAIAEGFTIMKKSPYKLDLEKVATLYNHGSVVTSRLVEWLKDGFEKYGQELKDVSGVVGHSGEGEWTAKTAKSLKVAAPIIEGSFKFRVQSEKKPSYTGRLLSAMRNMFGGHSINN